MCHLTHNYVAIKCFNLELNGQLHKTSHSTLSDQITSLSFRPNQTGKNRFILM